jgi:hypothetical protein
MSCHDMLFHAVSCSIVSCRDVACLWREALGGFRHYFDTVVMAVLGDNFSDYCDVF